MSKKYKGWENFVSSTLKIGNAEKRNKYGNVKTITEDGKFDSKLELMRYEELKLLVRANLIKNVQRQVKFEFIINDKLICTYFADFVYVDKDGAKIVEDCKSPITRKKPEYRIKKKLMKAVYDLEIMEILYEKVH